jgi:hypothetical protein
MVALLVLGLSAGLAGVFGVRDRANLVDGVTAHSGVLAVAAQDLYRSLSDADATAASAFLANGLEPQAVRDRYQSDIAAATAAVTVAAGGVSEGPGAAAVATITARLPVYTGLVETARAYNRQGVPLGSAYLREASGLMRTVLLPAAQELYRAVSARLADARGAAAAFPWVAVTLAVLALAGLVLAQVVLTRQTNRLVNLGLLVAAVAALTSVVWLCVASASAAGHLDASRRDGSAQVDRLAEIRIAALQARGDEALTLIARGNGAAFEQDYKGIMTRLIGADGSGGLLAEAKSQATDAPTSQAVESAIGHARTWLSVHQGLRALDDEGRYAEAVTAAIGADAASAGSAFNNLDEDLAGAIEHNGGRFDREARDAAGALSHVALAVALLTALLATGVIVGLQQRIAEYR